jgi:leader peptidase (prepilin peptidase) / N-methyltransferase
MHVLAHLDLLRMAFGGLLGAVLVALSVSDFRTMMLPDRSNVLLAVSGLGQSVVLGMPRFRDAVLGSIIGGGLLALLAALYRRLRGIDGLGAGDIKLVSAAGLWVGWQGMPLLVTVASISALAFVVIVRAGMAARSTRTTLLPFGPFLALGTLVTWLSMTASENLWAHA